MIRLEGGGGRETREEGKRCSRAAPNPTSWIQKAKWEEKRGKEGKKAEERGDFYKKIGFCKFLLGLYKRILEKRSIFAT